VSKAADAARRCEINTFKFGYDAKEILYDLINNEGAHATLKEQHPRIEVMKQTADMKVNGHSSVYKVVKCNGYQAFLASIAANANTEEFSEAKPFYVVLINDDLWQAMSDGQKRYRMDCAARAMRVEVAEDGTPSLKIDKPNIQTFSDVAARHERSTMADVQTLLIAVGAAGQTHMLLESDLKATAKADAEALTEEEEEALREGLKSGMVSANTPVADAVQIVKHGRKRLPVEGIAHTPPSA